ncbi:hypothetical protein CYMTET_4266 [Cymbomonas tetramitiformis]|uniref:Uncharacterized protein n=1 Tax=Cymbomonas tetramitiformis TaxID=36881 RepID=A0AAE0H1J0_9CHLO|nr:hypothetical protein CYMTET_4266 [Cymbomonas tetramitiformis]
MPKSKKQRPSSDNKKILSHAHLSQAEIDDDASLRGISLDYLLEFAWEHSAWDMPTHEVVRQLIVPATAQTGQPYTSLLPAETVGLPTIFVSHSWQNPFGLVVATARKYASSYSHAPFLWLDIFAITQHPGINQMNDLSRLEAAIARPESTTLLVLDEEGRPLIRCWCIFEIFSTLLHAGDRFGKLQVRAGSLVLGGTGEFVPCWDPERLADLANGVNALHAEASVPADKTMILGRLEQLGVVAQRNGVHELNRHLARAVRRGW